MATILCVSTGVLLVEEYLDQVNVHIVDFDNGLSHRMNEAPRQRGLVIENLSGIRIDRPVNGPIRPQSTTGAGRLPSDRSVWSGCLFLLS